MLALALVPVLPLVLALVLEFGLAPVPVLVLEPVLASELVL